MKKVRSKSSPKGGGLSPEIMAQLQAVATLPDDQIDTGDPDAPEVRDWTGAVRGRLYKPVKQLRSIRLDADVLAYYEAEGPGYQTRINRALREAMIRGLRSREQPFRKKEKAG